MRNRRPAASLIAASAVAALIPALAPTTATAADTTGAPRAATQQQFAPQKLDWKRCDPDAPAAFQCATVRVPLDYSRPQGKKLDIAISRIKATSPDQRRGVLLLNPGGPGGAGLDMPVYMSEQLPTSVKSRYDLIGFDPRGVGQSAPVTCGLSYEEQVWDRPYKAATFPSDVRWARTVAKKCAAKNGAKLPHLTTRNTARDMDAIRAALGEKKVSYLGYSYGTYLGAVYAQMFPARADRFVLDSAVDPHRIWRGMIQIWAEGAEPAFDRWTRWTAERNAKYALGKTPREVRGTFWKLVARADRDPIVIDGQKITGDDIRAGRAVFFSVREAAEAVVELKKAADGGKSRLARLPDILRPAAPPTFGRTAATAEDNGTASFWSVVCADTRNWPHDPETYRRDAIRDKAKYPLYGDFASNITPCAFWGKGSEPATKVNNRVPSLILQNEWDSQTPLPSGVGAHRAMKGSRMVTVAGGEGHGIYGSGSCADKRATTYLTTGKLPAKDLTCRAPEPKQQKSVRLPSPATAPTAGR